MPTGTCWPQLPFLSPAAWISEKERRRAAAADMDLSIAESSAFRVRWGWGRKGARMTQKSLVTIAVSKVTCGECQHMGHRPAAMTDRWADSTPNTHRSL